MKIAVVGHPCAGKTSLSEKLALLHPDYKVFHTDDYKPDYEHDLQRLMDDIATCKSRGIICEGTTTARLLRKGAETRSLLFDVVIECRTDIKTQMLRYTTERDADKWPHIPGFNKSLDTIFSDYKSTVQAIGKEPTYIQWTT